MRLRIPALLLLAVALAPLAAQRGTPDRERGFVRALVSELGFVSLAQAEVQAMQLRATDAEELRALAELEGEIALLAAQLHPDAQEQRRLYGGAIEDCERFLARYGGDDRCVPVHLRLSEAALELGRLLAAELELRPPADALDAASDLRSRIAQTCAAGNAACDAILERRADERDGGAARADRFVAWMRKAVLLREQARALPGERAALLDGARAALEELIFTCGERTLLGQRALFEYEQIGEVAGELEDAVHGYREVIARAAAALDHPPLHAEAHAILGDLLEEAYDRLGATLLRLGRNAEVAAAVQEYRARLRARGVPLTDLDRPSDATGGEHRGFGHGLYLSLARAMAAGGRTAELGKALHLLQWIAEQHARDDLGARAVAAIRDLAAAHAGAMSGAMLLEVAMIDYRALDFAAAGRGIATAIAAMSTAELQQLGLAAHGALGQALAAQGRDVEAAQALAAALAACTPDSDRDTRAPVVGAAKRIARRLRAGSGDDPAGEAAATRLADLLARVGVDRDNAGRRAYDAASDLLARQRYDEAILAYRSVGADSPYHELARAGIAVACQRKGDFAAARAEIAEYRAFLARADAALPGARADLRRARAVAEARVDFCAGYLRFLEGIGQGSGRRDPTAFPEVIAALADFADRHGDAAPELVPLACFAVARSAAETGDLPAAEARYRTLVRSWPRDPNIRSLAAALFAVRDAQVTAQTVEVDAIARTGDAEALARARRNLTALRHATVALGLDYLERAPAPQLAIAHSLLLHLEALADWPRLEAAGERVLVACGRDARRAGELDRLVRPSLGRALLEQHRFAEAYDVLSAAERADPDCDALKRLCCLALGGWQEIDARGEVQVYPGLGRAAEAYRKYATEYHGHALAPAPDAAERSLAWYRSCFELYWFAAQAGAADPELRAAAKTIWSIARADDDFARLTAAGEAGRRLRALFVRNAPLP
jgi:hypothetical protein